MEEAHAEKRRGGGKGGSTLVSGWGRSRKRGGGRFCSSLFFFFSFHLPWLRWNVRDKWTRGKLYIHTRARREAGSYSGKTERCNMCLRRCYVAGPVAVFCTALFTGPFGNLQSCDKFFSILNAMENFQKNFCRQKIYLN